MLRKTLNSWKPSASRSSIPKAGSSFLPKHSFFAAVSENIEVTSSGKNPSVSFFDESQELDEKMHAAMITGMQSRSEPLIIYCMTGGEKREGIGYEMAEYREEVEAGVITDLRFFLCSTMPRTRRGTLGSRMALEAGHPGHRRLHQSRLYREMAEQAKHLHGYKADFSVSISICGRVRHTLGSKTSTGWGMPRNHVDVTAMWRSRRRQRERHVILVLFGRNLREL